jgi:capsular exopolysaccharide synthesis family protein
MSNSSSGEAHADDREHRPSARVGSDSRALIPVEAVRHEITIPGEQPAGSEGPGIDQRALLGALRRQWFPAVSLGLILGLIAAGIAWAVVPITYTAYSELLVRSVPSKLIFDMQESRTQFEVYRQTQSRMVKSPFVLNAALRNPEIARMSILRDEPFPFEWLEKNVQVTNPATEFLRVSLAGGDPKEVAKIVNAITTEYLNEVVNSENNARTKRISELDKAHHDMSEQLRTRRATLKKLVTNLQTGDAAALSEKQKMMIELHSQLRRERAQKHFDLMSARIRLVALEDGKAPDDDLEIPEPVIEAQLALHDDVKSAEADIKRKQKMLGEHEKTSLKTKDGKEHPRMAGVRRDVEVAENSLQLAKTRLRPQIVEKIRAETRGRSQMSAATLKSTIRELELTLKELDNELEKQKVEVQQTGTWSLEVETLREDIAQATSIDQRLTEETERLKIETHAEQRVLLYREAEVPNAPDNQKRFKIVGASGFGTMALIFCGIVWFDVRSRRINSLDEVATGLRLPILGSLPTVPRHATNGNSRTAIAKADIWQGSLMESIDSARVMLLRRAELENAKVAMVVSAMMSEGKTTLSCHLATSLARAGHRTLLVDTDIRRPTVHRVFDMPCEPGMCEVLRGEVPLADAIVPTPQDGLFMLPAGRLTQEALRELAQDALNPIMTRLREDYDFVIVDSSPILPVTDSLLVSQYVDGVIFSIRRDVSQYPKVATACQRLAMIGIPLWGAVVIGLDQTSYGYRYAYQYGATQNTAR